MIEAPFRRALPMRSCLALLPLLLAAAPAWAGNDAWRIDPVHTRVLFSIDHAGYPQALGPISGSAGQLRVAPAHWREHRTTLVAGKGVDPGGRRIRTQKTVYA